MKKILHPMLCMVLALFALVMALPIAAAAELKPVVTVSFAGYDELMADIELIGKLGGRPQIGKLLEGIIAGVTQGRGLVGFDQKQPSGTVVLTDGSEKFTIYCFLPINDLDQLMGLIKNPLTGEGLNAEDGVYEIPIGPGKQAYLAQRGQWTYVVEDKETLDAVTDDPVSLLGDLPQKYLVAVQATLSNVPEAVRQQYLAPIMAGIQMGMQRNEGESDAQYEARTMMQKQHMQQIQRFTTELDVVTVGLNIDRNTNSAFVDLELTAKSGSSLAKDFAASKPDKSEMAGLVIPGAALSLHGVNEMPDAAVEHTKNTLSAFRTSAQEELKKQSLPDDKKDLALGVMDDLFNLAIKTIEMKRSDCALALVLEPNAITLVAGAVIADGSNINSVLEKLVAALKNENPDAAKFVKLNAETYKGIRFHTLSLPTPEPEIVPLVGDTLNVVLGVGDNKVFIAAGRDAAEILKQAIDKSASEAGKEVPPMQLVVSASKIAKFVTNVADDDTVKEIADKISNAFSQAEGKDHLTITSEPIANGMRVRLEIEEGILKTAGAIGEIPDPGM